MEERTMITIEGNIAAGKSTLGKKLEQTGKFAFLPEPVSEWQEGFEGNLLEMFYRDQKRWGFTFQMAAFCTRAKTWDEVLKKTDHSRVVMERSIYSDRYIFAKNCYEQGLINATEWSIYERLWAWLQEKWCIEPDAIIYINTDPLLCHERIANRERREEASIPLDYLYQLHRAHEDWLGGRSDVIEIDGQPHIDRNELLELLENAGVPV